MSEQILLFLIVTLAAAIVLSLAIVSWRVERRRREALAALAGRLGLLFSSDRSSSVAAHYGNLRGLSSGENRYAFNLLEGTHNGRKVTAFDFHYQTSSRNSKGGRNTSHHYLHAVVLHLPRRFPALFIAPENVLSKIAQAFGYDDIDFESHEFSRRFCVRSADRKFAYDFCNATMIDLLLDHPGLSLETRDGVLAAVFDGKMTPHLVESRLGLLHAVRDRMPDYLFANA